MSDPLQYDVNRLVAIAERVLAGEPIEDFDLGEFEIFVVTGYTQRALDKAADKAANSQPGGEGA